VLDYYHLSENIYKAAWAIYGEDSDRGRRWACEKLRQVSGRGGPHLIRSLRASVARQHSRAARTAVKSVLTYVEKHATRMAYPQLKEHGIDIGTGPLESACKNVVGARLKARGMRWRVKHVEALGRLRALQASYRAWDAFWADRAAAA